MIDLDRIPNRELLLISTTMYYVAFFAWHQLDAIFAHRPLLRKKVLQMAPTLNFRTRSVAN